MKWIKAFFIAIRLIWDNARLRKFHTDNNARFEKDNV